uniref:Cathepsin L1-like n=1 Tax=Callorhinchus milii TaxID=7868 RepID=A0A4W3K4D4_CALMI
MDVKDPVALFVKRREFHLVSWPTILQIKPKQNHLLHGCLWDAAVCKLAAVFDSKIHSDFSTELEFDTGVNPTFQKDAAFRRNVWEQNLQYIEKHNTDYFMGKHTFAVGMNQFGDMTVEEFSNLLNRRNTRQYNNKTYNLFTADDKTDLPQSVDWRPKGYVTGVKDQKACGSCWAFSTTGVLEGQWFKKTGKLISLSEQYLMDCSQSVGNHGCNGGYNSLSLLFIKEKGINSEESYPYTHHLDIATTGCNCSRKSAAVATVGPIAVGFDAGRASFMFYKSGIYYDEACSKTVLDHELLVVGYGTEAGEPYWIVKNSWGVKWGNKGYFHTAKDKGNNCGIASSALYPVV